jgi:hypothetical protein
MTPPPAQVLEHASTPAAIGEPGPGRPGRTPGWLPRGDRARATLAVIRREWVAGVFAVSAVFALVTALTSFNAAERVWGAFGAVSYTVSAVTAAVVRRRGVSLAVLISLAGAVAAPLAWMAVTGMAQPEVTVIIRSAAMLVHQGTPYPSPAVLAAAHSWRAYAPYFPALIVFGVPRALFGGLWSDPRIWFGAVFVVTSAVIAHPAAALVNTVLYPLGLAKVASPAASLLPGHLLASTGALGHWTALVLMALAGAGVGAWIIVRPPKDAHGMGWRLALGLALLFVLAPASRVGYFVYPLGLAAWLLLSRWPDLPGELSVDPEPPHGWLAAQGHR